MKVKLTGLGLLAVSVLWLSVTATAQVTTADLIGTVKDDSGGGGQS